jgi:hypothetical protein
MAEPWWIVAAAVVVFLAAGMLVWWPMRLSSRETRFADARRDFHFQRERLEMRFIQLAGAQAKPGSPRWADCEFDDDVSYVRNRYTGALSAFVGARVYLEGVDESLRADQACGVREATAVFRFDGRRWATDGRAIFNLTPSEAIRFYERDLEMVGQELAQRS